MGSSQLKATPLSNFKPEQNSGVGLDGAIRLVNPPSETRKSITDILQGKNLGDDVTIDGHSGDLFFGPESRPSLQDQARAFATSETPSAPPSLQQQFAGFQDAQPAQMIEPPQFENAQEASSSLLAKAMKRIGGQPATPKAETTGTTPITPDLSAPAPEEARSTAPKLELPNLAKIAEVKDIKALVLARAQFEQLAAQLSQQASQLGAQEQIIAAKTQQTPDSHIGSGTTSAITKTILNFTQLITRKRSLSQLATKLTQERKAKRTKFLQIGGQSASHAETASAQDLINNGEKAIGRIGA